MTNVLQSGDLQPVDFQTIKEGAKVIIQIPGSLYNNQQGEIVNWNYNKGTIEVRLVEGDQISLFPSKFIFYAPESNPSISLTKVNSSKLVFSDKVFIHFPKDAPAATDRLIQDTIAIYDCSYGDIQAQVLTKHHGISLIDWCDLYYPPAAAESKDVPVLIELNKMMDYLRANEVKLHVIRTYFSKPENQYDLQKLMPPNPPPLSDKEFQFNFSPPMPQNDAKKHEVSGGIKRTAPVWLQQKAVDDWELAVGDTVITNSYEETKETPGLVVQMSDCFGKEGEIFWVHNKFGGRAVVHGYWWPKSALSLVKKAGNSGTFIPVASDDVPSTKPFDLETAKKLMEEGPISERLVLFYYPELGKKQLPMSWEELPPVKGFHIDVYEISPQYAHRSGDTDYVDTYPTKEDAEAGLALPKLLQLRQAWLAIESPHFHPDWGCDIQSKFCVIRDKDAVDVGEYKTWYNPLSFPTEELATQFATAFPELLRTAFCLPNNTMTSENNNKD